METIIRKNSRLKTSRIIEKSPPKIFPYKIIKSNLSKYKADINVIFIGLTNSILNCHKNYKFHLKYIELLYEVDGNEFLKDFYGIKTLYEKYQQLINAYYYLYRIFPNYIVLEPEYTKIMMLNIYSKQKLIDTNLENKIEEKMNRLQIFNVNNNFSNFISLSSSSEDNSMKKEFEKYNPVFIKKPKQKLNDSINSIEDLITNIEIFESHDLNDSIDLSRRSSRRGSLKRKSRRNSFKEGSRRTSLKFEERRKSLLQYDDNIIYEENYPNNDKNLINKNEDNIKYVKHNLLVNFDEKMIKYQQFRKIKDFKKELSESKNNTKELVEAYYQYKINENSANTTNYSYSPVLTLPEIKRKMNRFSMRNSIEKNKLIKRKKINKDDLLLTKINNDAFKLIGHFYQKETPLPIKFINNEKKNSKIKIMKKKIFNIPCLLVE